MNLEPINESDKELIEIVRNAIIPNYDGENFNHTVGAAVRCRNGKVYTGVNVYSIHGACAEQVAIGAASFCLCGTAMKKVLVIGCPGAGKSTFARKLRDLTGLPLYYLDMIWHKPDGTNVSRDFFDDSLKEILNKNQWIIDGNYLRTLGMRLEACDTVFLLDYPLNLCTESIKGRIGKPREDMPWIETGYDEEFNREVLAFPSEQLPKIYDMLNNYRNEKNVIIFSSRDEASDYIRRYKK